MRRLRPGFANPGSGGWTKAVRLTLRSGCMSNDAISGGAAAGSLGYLRATLSCGSPSHRPCGPRETGSARQDLGEASATVSGERQVRTEIAARGTPKGSYKN